MRLNQKELENKKLWQDSGFELPQFDRDKMIKETKEHPEWVHFGGGNIFRAFPAAVCQDLLNEGIMSTGIIVGEGYDYEIIDKAFKNFDNLSVLVTLKADGNLTRKVIGSVAEALCVDTENQEDWLRLTQIFQSESLKMASFTITEKGYHVPETENDFTREPGNATSYIGKIAALCYERFLKGRLPLTLVSMDNCSHNGTKLFEAVSVFADRWVKNKLVEPEFYDYVNKDISYPWSMIDKITPRPADSVVEMLKSVGFEDTETVVTEKNTYVAAFVNAEEPQYLVIEDDFKNGRLPLNQGGIIYADRETVNKVEKMKVCTCLNPLHTALAIFGCLLSFQKIADEMKDSELSKLVHRIGNAEGLPVVTDPGIIHPKDFIHEVLNVRLPNPFLPDTPQRIACDTSQKLGVRFGETLKAYASDSKLNIKDLVYIPLVIAGWCRYLMGVDDKGNTFELSPDPMLPELVPLMNQIKLGDKTEVHSILHKILSDKTIFAADLYELGIGEKVEGFFRELSEGADAVRNTLKKYL